MHRLLLLWTLTLALLSLARAGEIEFTYTNSLDASTQQAAAYIPEAAREDRALPLVVIAHCYGANRFFGRALGYYTEAEKRGWLVVTPELHGHNVQGVGSFCAHEAQHDILDAIAYMQGHYKVDASRIYLVGRSMGGMMGMLMAAKYPDRFAAIIAGQGISDLHRWVEESPMFREPVAKECGAYGPKTAFEYARRSAINYAPNIQYVPFLQWHGTNDTWVPPGQSARLRDAVAKVFPYQPQVHWLLGAAHCPANYTAAWEYDQLQYYQNACEGGYDVPTRFYPSLSFITDEAQRVFWLEITPRADDRFARVTATLDGDTVRITTKETAGLAILLHRIAKGREPTRYVVQSDGPLRLRVLKDDTTAVLETTVQKRGQGAIPAP